MSASGNSGALRRAIGASTLGNVLEWFDFAVYGYMAPYIGPLFFPAQDPVASTIAAFAVFAVGYLARPLGAVLLGRIGDRYGRRTLLVLSIALLGGSSCSIGFLPTYAEIGGLAAVLLILLRLAQGFSVGGEYTGSIAYSTEIAGEARRGLLSSLATTGSMLGILLSSGTVWLVEAFVGPQALSAWGWRIPFLLGFVIMVFGLLLRRRIPETQPEGDQQRAKQMGLLRVLLGNWRQLVHIIALVTGANVVLYVLFVFVPDLATAAGELHIEAMNTLGLASSVPATALGGWLSDRYGRKRISFATNLAMAILVVPAFFLCVQASLWPGGPSLGQAEAFLLGQLIVAVPMGMVFGVQGAMVSEMLPREVRCTLFSVGYGLAMGLFAGTSPMMAEWMLKVMGWDGAPAFYMVLWLVLALWAVSRRQETAHRSLS